MTSRESMESREREPKREVYIDEQTARFYAGLRQLARAEEMGQNFGYCLVQLAEAPDYKELFGSMLQFSRLYRREGTRRALEAVEEGAGIPVDVVQPVRDEIKPGRIVGLFGFHHHGLPGTFDGVAYAESVGSEGEFVPVVISVDDIGTVYRSIEHEFRLD